MRGLKPYKKNLGIDLIRVASFTDAWIETGTGGGALLNAGGRIFYRCVD